MFSIVSNPKKDVCQAHGCVREAKTDKFCPRHHKRYLKHHDHARYTFYLFRTNAKRRGHSFEVTLAEFRIWCEETNYLERKGKRGKSASIDRIEPDKGYSIANMQVLSLALNSVKQWTDKAPF